MGAWCIIFGLQQGLPPDLLGYCLGYFLWILCGQCCWSSLVPPRIGAPLMNMCFQFVPGALVGCIARAVTSRMPVVEAIALASVSALFTCSKVQSRPWVVWS